MNCSYQYKLICQVISSKISWPIRRNSVYQWSAILLLVEFYIYKSSSYNRDNLVMYHKILQLHLIASLFKRNIEMKHHKLKYQLHYMISQSLFYNIIILNEL